VSAVAGRRWRDTKEAWPLWVLAIGAGVGTVQMVTFWYVSSHSRDWGIWHFIGGVLGLLTPWILCATGLRMSYGKPIFPWVKVQARVVAALGLALALVGVWVAVVSPPDSGFGGTLLFLFVAEPIFLVQCFLGLRAVVFTVRSQRETQSATEP
jgi:hypothetical protein